MISEILPCANVGPSYHSCRLIGFLHTAELVGGSAAAVDSDAKQNDETRSCSLTMTTNVYAVAFEIDD